MIVAGQSIAASDGVTTVLLYIRNKSGPYETRPLVSYTKRAIWPMRGEDCANNAFVTGVMVPAACWTDPGG